MASFPRVRPGLALAAACALAAGALTVASPSAEAVGALGAVRTLSSAATTPDEGVPAIAALPDGSTAVAWTSGGGTKIVVRWRGPHTATWGAARTISVPSGYHVDFDPTFTSRMTLTSLGSSRFLLVWHELNGANARVRAARITPTAIESPRVLSSTETDPQMVRVAVNASGRAVVAWHRSASSQAWFSVLGSTSAAAWSAPASLAGAALTAFPVPAVASTGAICFIWLDSPSGTPIEKSRCRAATAAPAAGHTWASGLGAVHVIGAVLSLGITSADLTAVGAKFLVAVSQAASGSSSISASAPPMSVRVRELSSASATTWVQRAVFAQPQQLLAIPQLVAAADGSVALHFFRIQGVVGLASGYGHISEYVATRTVAGAWTPMRGLSTYVVNNPVLLNLFSSVAVGPAGEVAFATVSPATGTPPLASVGAVGTAAGGFPQPTLLAPHAFLSIPSIAATGQVTFAMVTFDGVTSALVVRTTALAGGAS